MELILTIYQWKVQDRGGSRAKGILCIKEEPVFDHEPLGINK